MKIHIRPATVADADAVCAAEVETARIPGRLVSRPWEFSPAAFASRIEALRETGCYVVAEDAEASSDGTAALRGHAVLEPMGLEGLRHVLRLTIVVHPGWTGRGIGLALLRNRPAHPIWRRRFVPRRIAGRKEVSGWRVGSGRARRSVVRCWRRTG
jgi:L-amino acid N-acyltransferase YncA